MILKENGYFIGWVGKNHVPAGKGGYEGGYFEKVFDYWYGNHEHSHFYPKEYPRGKIYSNSKFDTQVEIFEEGAMNFLDPCDDFINSCISPLSKRDEDKPFCLCITFNLPHDNGTNTMQLRPTDDPLYKSKYRDKTNEFPLPKTYKSAWDNYEPKLPKNVYNGEQIPAYDYVRMVETLREKIVRTAQTVTGVDRMIGNLRKKLEELGEDENTVILFSTDHGLHFGEFGLGGKNFLYETDIRIPLVIYDPRFENKYKGQTKSEMVAVPDIAPTILSLAGIDVPDSMQGVSLLPLIWIYKIIREAKVFVVKNGNILDISKEQKTQHRKISDTREHWIITGIALIQMFFMVKNLFMKSYLILKMICTKKIIWFHITNIIIF
jgi:arylsulfatase A-like enzyme